MTEILITAGSVSIRVELLDTPTAQAILDALPITSGAQTWGEEVYFEAPLSAALEPDAKAVVTPGEMAFWTEGGCIAIGFGATPISQGDETRLAAACNIWGDAQDDVKALAPVVNEDTVVVEALD